MLTDIKLAVMCNLICFFFVFFKSLVLVLALEFAVLPWRTLLLASTSIVWHWDLWLRWMAGSGKTLGSSLNWKRIDAS